jgi:hypothetical protein
VEWGGGRRGRRRRIRYYRLRRRRGIDSRIEFNLVRIKYQGNRSARYRALLMTVAIRFNLFNVFVALLPPSRPAQRVLVQLGRIRRDVRRRLRSAVPNEGLLKKGRLLVGRAINQLV